MLTVLQLYRITRYRFLFDIQSQALEWAETVKAKSTRSRRGKRNSFVWPALLEKEGEGEKEKSRIYMPMEIGGSVTGK